ncbi:MAG TPA: bifunctional helix-turn-helix transcriptional regulator/GNAT family N-acetyltransferase [Gemmatimonadaceae bacterium]|nr:bifunctional helix-turn-helix transcriptional regulator/GNAT family N-acetyltransferase [Gemmatimonadaceae bacterium]
MQDLRDVAALREHSRHVVRELGFLRPTYGSTGCTHSQAHALVELDREGALTGAELAERLRQDPSTASRTIAQLLARGWARPTSQSSDRRRKPLVLTARGRRQLARVDAAANAQVSRALALLSPPERKAVLSGMHAYAAALARARQREGLVVRRIRSVDDAAMGRIIRQVMTEFGAVGSGYAIVDPEVSRMSAAYRGPRSAYFVIVRDGQVLGGGGIGPLRGGPPDTCELRKMYFLPQLRGLGMGREMLDRCLIEAKRIGYRRCYLETLERMATARALYESVGFRKLDAPMGDTGHHRCDAWYVKDLD